jgi:hypothetical protein
MLPESVLFPATVGRVTVPVKVGEAVSALVAIAVEIAVYSVSISAPRTVLLGSPVVRLSLDVKLVAFV